MLIHRHLHISKHCGFPCRIDRIAFAAMRGVHTLTFDDRPTRTAKDYMERGFANFICAHGMRYWAGPTTQDGKFCLIAPRLYFRVTPGAKHFEIEVDSDDTWAAYGWFPQVNLRDPQGRVVTTQAGPGKFKLTAEVQTEDQGSVCLQQNRRNCDFQGGSIH